MTITKQGVLALLCVAGTTLTGQAANVSVKALCGAPVASGTYRLTGSTTFSASDTYLLDGVILVGNGATLTIEAGTVVRGFNENPTTGTGIQYRPGMLVVERGGKLYANGTASNPIIFTDQWDNNVPGMTAGSVTRTWSYSVGGAAATARTDTYNYAQLGNLHGVWGGIVLCGKAFVNWDSKALGSAEISAEGLDAGLNVLGGGRNDDDSSGSIKYVQIRYGGSVLADTKEINGLTMYGVGRGTELHHIEVFNNQDDAFEWFGGCVNAKYLVVHGAGDDMFDSDAGFRGKNQFMFGVQRNLGGSKRESGCSDKGMEMDGFETDSASGTYLYSASAWYNLTLVGWGEPNPGSGKQKNIAVQLRDNASPQINNSVFMDFGCYGTFIENRTDYGSNLNPTYRFGITNNAANLSTATTTDYLGNTVGAAYFYKAQRPGKQAHIKDCLFWNIIDSASLTGALYPVAADAAALNTLFGTTAPGGKGPYFSTGLGSYTGWTAAEHNNVTDIYNDGTTFMPIASRSRSLVVNRAPYATSTKGYDVTQIDPRAANDAVHAAAPVVSDGWLTPAAYRGAFDPYSNWARGWTMMDRIGLFGAAATVTETEAGVAITDFTVASPIAYFSTQAGVTYRVKAAATVDGTYSTIAELVGTGSQVSYLDVGATDPAKFYKIYVVTQN
jgi:hypothetical protein